MDNESADEVEDEHEQACDVQDKPAPSSSGHGAAALPADAPAPYVRIDVASIESHQPYWGRSKDMQ